MTKITMDGQYQTRDGKFTAQVAAVGLNQCYPVIAILTDKEGEKQAQAYTELGGYSTFPGEHELDLIPIPKKIRVRFWVNVYNQGDAGTTYDSKAEADDCGGHRFALIEIDREVTEGEGL